MICGIALLAIVMPANINQEQSIEWVTKPYIVQAVIDSARIIGLPSSRSAKLHARKIQSVDPIVQQISIEPNLLSERKLFFRNYFK
jgi:hypothetical protein